MVAIANIKNSIINFNGLNEMIKDMMKQGSSGYSDYSSFSNALNFALKNTENKNAKIILNGIRYEKFILFEEKSSKKLAYVIFDADLFKIGINEAMKGMSKENIDDLELNYYFKVTPIN